MIENLIIIILTSASVAGLTSYVAIRVHLKMFEMKVSNLLEEQDKDFKDQLDEVNKIVFEALKK